MKEPINSGFHLYVALIDRNGQLVRRVAMPHYCNHYHAHLSNEWLVGDEADASVLINIAGEEACLEVLCEHGTSWHTQASHCHPTWSWDGRRILYASGALICEQGGVLQKTLCDISHST